MNTANKIELPKWRLVSVAAQLSLMSLAVVGYTMPPIMFPTDVSLVSHIYATVGVLEGIVVALWFYSELRLVRVSKRAR